MLNQKSNEENAVEEIKKLQFDRGKKDALKGNLPRSATLAYLKGYLEGKNLQKYPN